MGSGVKNALVKALKAATKHSNAGACSKFANAALGNRLPTRRHRQNGHIWLLNRRMIDRCCEYIRAQYHPRPAAGGRVVNGAVLVGRKVTDVDGRT